MKNQIITTLYFLSTLFFLIGLLLGWPARYSLIGWAGLALALFLQHGGERR